MIHTILIKNNFIKIDADSYILTSPFSYILIKPEEKVNERYTARDYVFCKNDFTYNGKIFTNDIDSFENTLNRILKKFTLHKGATTHIDINKVIPLPKRTVKAS